MENYDIEYEIIYRGKYNQNLINIKFISNQIKYFITLETIEVSFLL